MTDSDFMTARKLADYQNRGDGCKRKKMSVSCKANLSYLVMTSFGQTVEGYLPTNASDTAAIQAQGGS
jgi:hypothetical protein